MKMATDDRPKWSRGGFRIAKKKKKTEQQQKRYNKIYFFKKRHDVEFNFLGSRVSISQNSTKRICSLRFHFVVNIVVVIGKRVPHSGEMLSGEIEKKY